MEEIIKLYLHYKSMRQVSYITGLSRNKVSKILKRNNIQLEKSCLDKKPSFKENFFSNVQSEIQQYWLGFLWADGYLNKKNNSLRLELKDKDHIEKFCKDLSYPIKRIRKRKDKNTWFIHISSKKMSQDLQKLGFKENVPEWIDRHFLRGFFDGDGSIYHQGKTSFCTSIIGTLEDLKKLSKLYPFPIKKFREVSTSKGMYRIETHGIQSSLEFSNLIYDNAGIFLTRKYCKYRHYKYMHEETSTTKLEPS